MTGIYIHIPFCKQACNYCNFHFSTSLRLKEEFIAALTTEIYLSTKTGFIKDSKVQTLYFGGGTPSILDKEDLQLIFSSLKKYFVIADKAEITLEANPDDISIEKLQLWKKLGINRLSVGIQSFSEAELIWMNRAHTAADSLKCIDEIIEAGFTDFSIDLIYGSPLLSNTEWKKTIALVIDKNIPHISCYALTVEPKTALEKQIRNKTKVPVDAEKQAEQFIILTTMLQQAGYEHYEISNFAKPDFRSKHNSSYWQGKPYYGFGPSAHSFNGIARRWNIANNALYIQSLKNNIIPFEEEQLTGVQQLNEYIMTSLRTMEGISLDVAAEKFGEENKNTLLLKSKKWLVDGKMIHQPPALVLSDEGRLFADGIAADLFF